MAQWVKTLFENVATTAMPHQGPCLRGMDTGTRFSNRTQTIALAIGRFFSLNILKVSLFIIVWAFVQMYHNTGIRSAEDSFQKCGCRRQLRPSCLVAASTFTCWAVLLPHDTFFNGFWCKFYVFEEHMMGLMVFVLGAKSRVDCAVSPRSAVPSSAFCHSQIHCRTVRGSYLLYRSAWVPALNTYFINPVGKLFFLLLLSQPTAAAVDLHVSFLLQYVIFNFHSIGGIVFVL